MAIPFPNLNFAAPSTAAASGTLSSPFNIGSGSAGGLVPTYVWYAAIAFGAFYLWKRR